MMFVPGTFAGSVFASAHAAKAAKAAKDQARAQAEAALLAKLSYEGHYVGLVYTSSAATAEPKPKLPFFLDPEQIRDLTPGIDWNRRVGDRIRHFEEWGRAYLP